MTQIGIVGSGPAGLMAATEILNSNPDKNIEIHLFEKRSALGRKLLIAGSSGLNISHELTLENFASHYDGFTSAFWTKLLSEYGCKEWIRFIETQLGLETFLGTSNRYFVREMKASGLLRNWIDYLKQRNVHIHAQSELIDFSIDSKKIKLKIKTSDSDAEKTFDQVIFALGGASWETETPAWAELFAKKNLNMIPFEASNVGYEVDWSAKFLAESEGKPLKKVTLETARGKKLGELVVTKYGLEGTPIYFCGMKGHAFLDLKPDLTEKEILEKLSHTKENFSPMRRVKHYLSLSEAAESLIFHQAPMEAKNKLETLISLIKRFPLELKQARPLSESISSRGGLGLDEIKENLELKKYPGIFCVGEMLAWDAPTGGFLIQASISQGARAGRNIESAAVKG